ncbi:sulfurtransferase/chromate resistance protein [Defluviimonas salinarum]|uniref:Sulfurtransferase/chromate resistance protein n=1 Tax=Defluviimonas salinarum TaxID=2992147 RepID=A0ABT3IXZ3_9RHOB|nr:sulfurtransferase/chromate resistance protein [Defluviimonas salinarum]MCW3780288.1 sulfurtransferase/chromate resistance protein [Defluviimonas salinarum]
MPGFSSISPSQLARLVGTPDCPVLIDIRTESDFSADPRLIPGAFRHAFDRIEELAGGLTGKRAVAICQKGQKLSEGAAALLRCHGVAAESLEGGVLAWAAEGLPMLPAATLPGSRLWVTRHRPKIDRIACPWLIRRFVDAQARFLFVAPSEVAAVADRFGATPYDVEGVPFSHRGELCSFDALLDDFCLHTEALDRLALVVRGADTDRHDLAPQAAGLLAISVGLSRQYRDDLAQLEAGMAVYDALYRWARDGYEEGHDWPATRRA